MAGTIRHMGVFHRLQAIVHYFQYTDDMETYQNLSKFKLHNLSCVPSDFYCC
jgi:hypothetical protein